MSEIADKLYAEGEQLYKGGEFAGAERAFRRLLEVVPQSDGKAYGRAAYSLALSLLKQARTVEAKDALRAAVLADPALHRARERLDELDRQPTPRTPGGIVGVARRVRLGSEPDPWFGQQRNPSVSFRLETPGTGGMPRSPTVELRGQRIAGSVEDGDLVELPASWRPGERPEFVLNLTTGETVRASQSGTRVVQWAVLSLFLVAFAAFLIFALSHMLGG